MIGVKRGKTCESRLVGFASDWTSNVASGASVSVQNQKRRNAKPKRMRITFDIQVNAALASPFSTEKHLTLKQSEKTNETEDCSQ